MTPVFDIVFIGSGISCTYTLIHFLETVLNSGISRPHKVALLEKSGEFWTGIPYGYRSGTNSLIITSLQEFIPESERNLLTTYLTNNFEPLLEQFKASGGIIAPEWLDRNTHLVKAGNWNDIYLPRYFYGRFLTDRVSKLIEQASALGLLDYNLISAEVKNISKIRGKYHVSYRINDNDTDLHAEKVVLSIGSPPKKPFVQSLIKKSRYKVIEDIYEPDINSNLSSLANSLKINSTNKVLVIGSNASALEFFYNLTDYPELETLIDRYYVVSPGRFPHRITVGSDLSDVKLACLTDLKDRKKFCAEDIFEAVRLDTEAAEAAGINIADIINTTSSLVIELLNRLSSTQQKEFVHRSGVEIGKLQRRAGHEYLNAVKNLLEQDKLELIQGKFAGISEDEQGLKFEYKNPEGRSVFFDEPVQAVINCAGFEDLSENSVSALIKNLITTRMCKPNKSKRGFRVNERFEANKNLYVMGPLLAGNINKNLRVWHAESCSRIFSLSKQLAVNLLEQD